MCILSANFVAHVWNLYLLVKVLDFGIVGVGIATSTTYSLNFIMLTLYCQFQSDTKIKVSWNFWNPMIIKCIPKFLRYGVPSWVALLLYWLPYELTIIYGGWLGVNQSAGSTILNSIIYISSEVPYGIAMTASGIIGFNLGANLPNKARVYTISTFMLASLSSPFICIVLYTLKDEIIKIYTKDAEVIKIIESSMIEFTIFLFIELFNWWANGVLRGMGYTIQIKLSLMIYLCVHNILKHTKFHKMESSSLWLLVVNILHILINCIKIALQLLDFSFYLLPEVKRKAVKRIILHVSWEIAG